MTAPARWQIRPLKPAEVERVGAVLGLARLHQGDGVYLVAWENAEPIGHAHLALTEPPELQDVSVRPEHRRRDAYAGGRARGPCARLRPSPAHRERRRRAGPGAPPRSGLRRRGHRADLSAARG